jgi:PAS domain S-box-containing protein
MDVELPPLGETVGSFRFLLADQRWEWSAEVARMHGYEPGNVVPTTELVLAHKHPDDKPDVALLIERVIREGHPFSSRHRIIDTNGRIRHVVVVGDQLFAGDGQVIGTAGFYIDMTDAYESDVNDRLSKVLGDITAARATIEQAKGILMFVYALTADRAFDLLQWRSQETNIKVRDLSSTLVRVVTEAKLTPDTLRHQVDHFLLTAHHNVPERREGTPAK